MATYENDVILRTQDEDGNDHINYPITHGGNVLIPDDLAEQLAIAAEKDPTVSLALAALVTALEGKAAASHGTHVTFATAAPKEAGTAAVGTSDKVAREDHVHPAQTTVSGNAGSATTLKNARYIDGVSFNGAASITHYGTCSTAAATAEKEVSLTGFALTAGAEVKVKFTVTNTAENPTLNVNSTGAKAIYYRGVAITAGHLAANRTYLFVYDGTQYDLVGDIDTNSEINTTKFMQGLGVITSGDIKEIALGLTHAGGFGVIGSAVTGMPVAGANWYTTIERGNTSHVKITATSVATHKTYTMTYNSGTSTWSGWGNAADGGNAATLTGVSVVTDNSLGLHRLASGTAEASDDSCPNGVWYGQHV